MSLKIECVNGGYIVADLDDTRSYSNKTICSSVAEMLQTVNELIGDLGSRYDDKRVYVIEAPGDKNDAFTDEHARVIWGDV